MQLDNIDSTDEDEASFVLDSCLKSNKKQCVRKTVNKENEQ